ncbi:MAG: hypothetical protein WD768_02175 [Phycisphaeraceae bacterium]
MSKHDLITAIRQRNRSASEQFLSRFNEAALATYLRRLSLTDRRGGLQSVWVREGTSPACVGRR